MTKQTTNKNRKKAWHVLVVDDVKTQRKVVKNFIERKYNFKTAEAEDGLVAVQKTFKHKFDLVISDLVMPNMNGMELCAFLNDDPDFCGKPFIMLSSVDDSRTINQAKALGAYEYLVKPLKEDELSTIIDELTSNHTSSS